MRTAKAHRGKQEEGGEKIMKNRLYIWFASVFVMAVVMSFGCGGGGDNYTGPTSTVRISGSSSAAGAAVGANGTILFDASGESEGSGGTDGVESIFDAIQPQCMFELAGEAFASGTTEDGLVEVRLSTDPACASENKCITCTLSGWLQTCTIECEGTVPSNASVAADAVKIKINFAHYFATDMPDSLDAAMTFKGVVTGWEEFLPNNGTSGENVVYDYTNCNGTDNMDVNDGAAVLQANATSWVGLFAFEGNDPVADSSYGGHTGLQECIVGQTMIATMPLTGAATPGSTVDITGGSVTLTGTLCDFSGNCDTPALNP